MVGSRGDGLGRGQRAPVQAAGAGRSAPRQAAALDAEALAAIRAPARLPRRGERAAAGLGTGYSGHSGRVGLAVRMTAKGAPTHAVMLAGRWQGAGIVACYTRSLTAADAARYL